MVESQVVANEAIKKLEDQLTCAVCLDSFKQPKMLNCFHIFCEHCLQRMVVQDRQGQLSLACPTCRRSTLLPQGTSVSGLQSAFHVHHLFEIKDALEKMKEPKKVECGKCKKVSRPATSFCRDCGQFICARCADIHADWEEFASHDVVDMDRVKGDALKCVPLKKVIQFCPKHGDQQLRLYCDTCDDLICHDCTVKLHQGHQYDLISDAFEGHKADIVALLAPVKKQVCIVDKKLKNLDARCTEITDQRTVTVTDIRRAIQGFIEILKRREAELIGLVDQVVDPKLKNLAAQRDEMETVQARLGSCLSFVSECLQTGSQGEILKMRKRVVKQIETMTAEFNEDTLSPCEEANVRFATVPSFADACRQIGDVYIPVVAPGNCYATGKGLEVAVVNEKATACVHTLDQCGKCFDQGIGASITVEVVSENGASKIKGNVGQLKDGQYEISYQPTSIGKHQLNIKIDCKHIKGSPFTVTVRRQIKKLGTPIMTISGVQNPWGVAVNKKGEIIVAEEHGHCVSVYSPTGEKLRSFGLKGTGQGQFINPRGVAVDDDGNILVSDSFNNRIQKFTSDGKFITAVGSHGKGPLQFDVPTGIAIHPINKRVYLSEGISKRVQILNPDLTSHSMFGGPGSGDGCFIGNARGLAFDSGQNVYVGERRKTRIQVFTAAGDHLRWLGDKELDNPHDVSIDSNDTVYVCETFNHQICIFDSNGTLLHSFGSYGTAPGQFSAPCGITVDKINGLIYVSDYYNGRVQIF